MKLTAAITAQNTSIYICDIHQRRGANDWFASVMLAGTFGGGTVTLQISNDGGTTKATVNQDGTATAASATAAGVLNVRSGYPSNLGDEPLQLYATIATATNPSINITAYDNR